MEKGILKVIEAAYEMIELAKECLEINDWAEEDQTWDGIKTGILSLIELEFNTREEGYESGLDELTDKFIQKLTEVEISKQVEDENE